jgi:ribosomal protein L7/L12
MENILKGTNLLHWVNQESIHKMEQAALVSWQKHRISFKFFKVTDKDVTIGVTQAKTKDGEYFSKTELIKEVHNTFDVYFIERKVMVHASPYEESPALKVDAEWIKKKMDEHGITLKEMADETGLNNTQLSPLTTGSKPLSDAMKAMFYFYFRSKE